MLEELCRDAFYTACWDKIHDERLVWPKSERKQERRFSSFCIDAYLHQDWHFIPIQCFIGRGKRVDSVERKAWVWFSENSNKIYQAYIKQEYAGDIERAMEATGSFTVLFDGFKAYFAERRKELMEKTKLLMQSGRAELTKQGKPPQSHGGVANLLKVLTKTMQGQGSSIYTIAKVQYAVCMQAGIYIPDEFLTDVLTAAQMMEG